MGFSQIANSWMIVFPIIVILYYFFRKKYKRTVISSTMFWEEAMQETNASPYLKKFQKNLLLLFQLLAMVVLIIALMNPIIRSTAIAGEQVIFIVDTSASMLAGKETPLFEQYKDEMLKLVDGLNGKELTIITTGKQPAIVLQKEQSSSVIRKAIEQLKITYENEQMVNAFNIAQSFISDTPTSIYVFTDALDKTALPMASENVEWNVYGLEEQLENVAITKFAAMEQDDAKTLMIQLKNDTSKDQNVQIIIEDENNTKLDQVITVESNEVKTHVISNAFVGNLLKATIIAEDDYDVDNTSFTIVRLPSGTVQLDPSMHLLVQKGFASVYDDVVYFTNWTDEMDEQDIIVTSQVEALKSNQRVLLFGRNDVEPIEINQYANSSNHALFNFSPLDEVYVQSIYPPFDYYEVLATVGDQPFIQLSDKGDIIVLTDISMTDWAMHPVFPLFLWSALQQFSSTSDMLGAFTPLQTASIVVADKEWSIFDANNEFVQALDSSRSFRAPSMPGIYTLEAKDEKRPFIVDISQEEKVLKMGESYKIGSVKADEQKEQDNSLVQWLIPIILLLLLLEWEVQRRRGFAN